MRTPVRFQRLALAERRPRSAASSGDGRRSGASSAAVLGACGAAFALLLLGAQPVVSLAGAAPSAAGHSPSGCWMSLSPTSGPAGTVVSITGSTATCGAGAGGGMLSYSAEQALALVHGLPTAGPFHYYYRLPTSMPSGSVAAAAMQGEGGGPVSPGPTSFVAVQGAEFRGTFTVTANPVPWADYVSISATAGGPSSQAYYLLTRSGGWVDFPPPGAGTVGGLRLPAPVVGSALAPSATGYWDVTSKGNVFNLGTPWYGSTGAVRRRSPVVGMAATPDGKGYWLVTAAGNVFNFGDAVWYGSASVGPQHFPAVGMAAGPGGKGYWLAFSDGGVFTYGNIPFEGSGRCAPRSPGC